jgi:hypothetical protein
MSITECLIADDDGDGYADIGAGDREQIERHYMGDTPDRSSVLADTPDHRRAFRLWGDELSLGAAALRSFSQANIRRPLGSWTLGASFPAIITGAPPSSN